LIANKYIQEVATDPQRAPIALKAIEEVVSIAKSGAGRSASREFGISFLDAIPHESIDNEKFRVHRLPRLLVELKQAAGADLAEPDVEDTDTTPRLRPRP
jgi:hypothetical protein